MSRRSESCPRLARKDCTPQAQPLSQPLAPSAPRSCTLQDLGPEDRQKVAKLLKQVVDLGQEVQQLKQQRDELTQQAKDAAQRQQELQEGSQQLHKEHHSLKRKLGQVLLVLRASQAKVAALEAAQQQAASPRRSDCSVDVEVQTEPVAQVEPQAPVASCASVCGAGNGATPPPAATAAQPASGAEPAGTAETAALRATLSSTPGGPPVVHVAPGAHVSITINQAPEPAAAVASAGASGAPTPFQAMKAPESSIADSTALPAMSADSCEGSTTVTLAPGGRCAGERGLALAASPAPATVIAIPTTTAAVMGAAGAAAASAAAMRDSTEVALPEVSSSSFSTTAASYARVVRAGASGWSVQQQQQPHEQQQQKPAAAGMMQGDVGPAAMPKAPPRAAAAVAAAATKGQPGCRPAGPRNILVDATMQCFEDVPVHEVRLQDSREVLTASPMIVPPSDEVVAAASSILGWQAQHGLAAAATAAGNAEAPCGAPSSCSRAGVREQQRSGRKVLSFDPAIGESGAFYFVDVAAEPAGGVGAAGPAQAHRQGRDGEGGGRPPGVAIAAPAAERFTGSMGAQPASQQFMHHGGEATLRPWAEAAGAGGGCGHPGGPMGASAQHQQQYQYQQHPHPYPHHHQQQQQQCKYQHPVPEHMVPASPCSSYATETTGAATPFSHGAPPPARPPHAYSDTPASSTMSLSRMAVALDEVARRQRWDVQPPGMLQPTQQHQHDATPCGPAQPRRGGHAPQLGGGAGTAVRQGGPCHGEHGANSAVAAGFTHGARKYRDPHCAQGPPPQLLRHASAGSFGAARPSEGGQDLGPHADSLSACGSTSTSWLGGSDVADRYDDSLVDILSQADEELEQQQHHHRQRYRRQPQAQRSTSQGAAAPSAAPMPTRPRTLAPAAASPLSEGAPSRTKMQAASAEALLAANLYEENDVFSVILEQEGRM
ncbi:hypothetical protein PLESTM_001616900 [Pleodorina starrii]|nr:hypothetical protein PLESTM_001616900 [Pleodorina starrii]